MWIFGFLISSVFFAALGLAVLGIPILAGRSPRKLGLHKLCAFIIGAQLGGLILSAGNIETVAPDSILPVGSGWYLFLLTAAVSGQGAAWLGDRFWKFMKNEGTPIP